MEVFKGMQVRGHEQVVFFSYPKVGLKAVVAIHNTNLGPALGGCRMRPYESEAQAIEDALRLSEGMTYKSSLAGLSLGGGKSCIIADPKMKEGRRELFLQFGKCLNSLGGRYITAEDMGTSVEDIMVMREVTDYAAGYAALQGGSGDPSPWTARGLFKSVLAVCKQRYGSSDLSDKHVAVQGIGHVGRHYLKMLREAGAKVTVCDTNEALLEQAKREFGVEAVTPDKIYDVKCNVFSPCAIGQTVNRETLMRLSCDIIAGAANNQLSDSSVYALIEKRGITYCPDFVVNAGGVISVSAEYNQGGWKEAWVTEKVDRIADTIVKVIDESKKRGRFPEIVAVEVAKERVQTTAADQR